ncbi:MAG: ubiquinone/menaquinone biosynthesis methyltransferase [Chloroflexi bacterium]|nr:ubiquinone/menaquinone biosynthesis methyltransferase [Chloroflexota bacterium]
MKIKEMFKRISPRYDLANRILSGGLDTTWRKQTAALMGIGEGGKALDLCTGTGDLAMEIYRQAGFAEVTGIDFCPEILELAKKKFPQERYPGLTFIEGDVYSIPFQDNYFDAAGGGFFLRNLPDLENFMKETFRVLKPGGRAVFLDMFPPECLMARLYIKYGVPFVGWMITGMMSDYKYLGMSILNFKSTQDVMKMMEDTGFISARCKAMFYQSPNIVWAVKPGGGEN